MTKEYGRMRFVLMVALVAGCSTKPNPKSCLDNHCSDPELPFCDVDGSIGGEPNTCIAVECTPNEFEGCRGDRALTCNATGDSYDLVQCEFGCGETGCNACDTADCEKRIIPRYLPTICETLAAQPELKISTDRTLNTSTDLECTSVVAQPSGPEICVLHYNSITLERNRTYTVTGTRAVALVADYALVIDGLVDISATGGTNGPGGGLVKSGSGEQSAGGGGAGARDAGGSGGTTAVGGAGNGGATGANPASLVELFGGTQATRTIHSPPGGGGGAATLISCRGEVSVPGTIDAGGGGGGGAAFTPMGIRYAGGGGSGGTVVLQGMSITVTGEIYANGGGGGSGSAPGGQSGQDGRRSTSRAVGGSALNPNDGAGGLGGTALPPTSGGASVDGFPGAGGGSAGFILTYTPEFVFPNLMPFAVSPAFESAGHIATN